MGHNSSDLKYGGDQWQCEYSEDKLQNDDDDADADDDDDDDGDDDDDDADDDDVAMLIGSIIIFWGWPCQLRVRPVH